MRFTQKNLNFPIQRIIRGKNRIGRFAVLMKRSNFVKTGTKVSWVICGNFSFKLIIEWDAKLFHDELIAHANNCQFSFGFSKLITNYVENSPNKFVSPENSMLYLLIYLFLFYAQFYRMYRFFFVCFLYISCKREKFF